METQGLKLILNIRKIKQKTASINAGGCVLSLWDEVVP